MFRIIAAGISIIILTSATTFAANIDFGGSSIDQGTFKTFSKEAGMALAYRVAAPPHALGLTGFDAGLEMSLVSTGSSWDKAFNGSSKPDYLVLPKLRARKGLPFGIDVGAMYSNLSNTNIQLVGLEVNKSFIDGGALIPALAVRGSYTKLFGVKDLDIQTAGLDVSVGKGILFVTPYAGGGAVWIDSKLSGNLKSSSLKNEGIWQPRGFAGIEVKPLPLIRVLVEAEYAVRPIITLKASLGF